MAEDVIDSYIDRTGVQQDTEFMLGELNKLLKGVQEAKGAISTFGSASGFKEVQQASVQAATAINGMTEAAQRMEQAGKQVGLTWTQFVGQRMGAAMKEAMAQGLSHADAHTQAIRKISAEWKEYKASGQSAISAVAQTQSQATTQTISESQKAAQAKRVEAQAAAEQARSAKAEAQAALEAARQKKAEAATATELARAKALEAKAVKDLANASKLEAQTQKELANAKKAQVQTENEVIRQMDLERRYTEALSKEKDKLQASIEKELKQQARLNNEYEQLKAKYTIAANTAKQLAAAKGLDNEETKEAVAMAQQYYNQLMNIEKAVGQNQRNVGNYTQATFALNQVLREAPAFANSVQTGFMALSNNIPILRDEFVKLREATGSTGQAMGILMKSLLSWNTVLLVGVTLLTVYGKEIGEWTKALFAGKKGLEDTTVAMKRFKNEAEEAKKEISALKEQIQFLNELGKINVDINTTNMSKVDVMKAQLDDLRAESILAGESVVTITDKVEQLKTASSNAYALLLNSLGKDDMKVFQKFGGDLELASLKMSEEGQKMVEGYKATQTALVDAEKEKNDALNIQRLIFRQIEKSKADITREQGEQARELIKESVVIESDLVKQKNALILNNERSTLNQRVTALQSSLRAQRRAIEAERDAILNDPTSRNQDGTLTADAQIAIKRAGAAIMAAELDTQAEILQVREDFRLRDLEAQQRAFEQLKTYAIDLNEELSENTAFSLEERLRLQEKYVTDQRAVLEAEYRLKLQQAGISDEEIAALEANRNYKVKSKKITDEELKALQVEHDTQILQLAIDTQSKTTDILKAELQKQKGVREAHLRELQYLYDTTSLTTSTDFARDLMLLNEQFQQKKITLQQYNAEREQLETQFQQRENVNLINHLQSQLRVLGFAKRQELTILGRIAQLKIELEQATTAEEKKAVLDKIEVEKEALKEAEANVAKQLELEKKLNAAKVKSSEDSTKRTKADMEEQRRLIIQMSGELSQLGFDIGISGIDREKQAIEEQISLLEEKKNKDIEVANQTILNADERTRKIKEIEARAAAEKVQLERRQRQLDMERARFERAQAIASIIQNTAIAVSGYLARGNVAMSIFAGVIGAAQIARVLAQPLPKYRHGKRKEDTYEGLAVVGDGGKKEVIERADGRVEVTPKTDTITWIGKGDVVHPDADKFFELQMQMANRKVGQIVANYHGKEQTAADLTPVTGSIDRMRKDVVKAVKSIPQTSIQVEGIGRKWIKSSGSYTEFI